MAESKPKHFAVALFEGFQMLDAMGPLDTLHVLSTQIDVTVSTIALKKGLVSTEIPIKRPGSTVLSVQADYTFDNPPENIEVLLVPGGYGTRNESIQSAVDFVKKTYPSLKYIISVCTGALVLARSGILDGKKATSNKQAWEAVEQFDKVDWQPVARWVKDGNIYTCSGISAGIDGFLALVEEIYGRKLADHAADAGEINRVTDPSTDPFAIKLGLQNWKKK